MTTTNTTHATVRYASTVEGMFGYSAFEVVRGGEFVTRFVFPTEGDAARTYLPAVTLVDASAVKPCYCAGCSHRIEARSALVISSRDCDLNAVFDVTYCSRSCRASTVGGTL